MYDDALRPVAARALAHLGIVRAWVVRSTDGLDEVSPCGAETRVSEVLAGGEVRERTVSARDFGVRAVTRAAIAGDDAGTNADAIVRILERAPHPARDAVILNAAAALAVADERATLEACAERARDALDSGRARETLERWRAAAARYKAAPPTEAT